MKKIKAKIRYYLPNLILLLTVFAVIAVFSSRSTYIDVLSGCLVRIDRDLTKGNTQTIKQAIALLKDTDQQQYKDFCRNVREIKEKYCLIPEVPVRQEKRPGCYIRGSRVIYVMPEQGGSETVVKKRMETIATYAQKSKVFWESRK